MLLYIDSLVGLYHGDTYIQLLLVNLCFGRERCRNMRERERKTKLNSIWHNKLLLCSVALFLNALEHAGLNTSCRHVPLQLFLHTVTHCLYVCNRCALETLVVTPRATSSPELSSLTWLLNHSIICSSVSCTDRHGLIHLLPVDLLSPLDLLTPIRSWNAQLQYPKSLIVVFVFLHEVF